MVMAVLLLCTNILTQISNYRQNTPTSSFASTSTMLQSAAGSPISKRGTTFGPWLAFRKSSSVASTTFNYFYDVSAKAAE